jgi:hypothetical protein
MYLEEGGRWCVTIVLKVCIIFLLFSVLEIERHSARTARETSMEQAYTNIRDVVEMNSYAVYIFHLNHK